jgi:CubicO group peptidase (beta-lactamase class C family)
VYPGKTWERRPPAAVGLDDAKLEAFAAAARGRGCVVRAGYLVFTWGDHTRRGDVASACKPWFTHFLLKALEARTIPSLDEKVIRWEPRLGEINAALGHKDRDITWRHLATQTSCYGVAERPGTAFDYNDWQMTLFSDTLFQKVYGAAYETVDAQVLHPLLTDVLECEDAPTLLAFNIDNRPGRVGVSPRDFCRFGLLYLRKGMWKGKRLIGEESVALATKSPLPATLPRAGMTAAEMIPGQRSIGSLRIPDNQCDHEGSYSMLWWVNGTNAAGKRLWPEVPVDAYGAFGHGGPRAMAVIPSLDLIVSWNDAKLEGWDQVGRALGMLVRACTPATSASG